MEAFNSILGYSYFCIDRAMQKERRRTTTSTMASYAIYRQQRRILPKFYHWGGGGLPIMWSFGWETGRDNDLICVQPKVGTALEGEMVLSPVCRNRPTAIFAFLIKNILIRIDDNIMHILKNS